MTVRDTVLAHSGWFADDSLFYTATNLAMNPRVLRFRPRLRRSGEEGPFVIPESVRGLLSEVPEL